MVRRRGTLIRDPPIRSGRRGRIIPSLDPITRARRRGGSGRIQESPRARPPPIPISARPRPVLGSDFGVLQPFRSPRRPKPPLFGRARAGARGRRPIRTKPRGRLVSVRDEPFRTRPTRVEVAQPSGRAGRLITVSSRSILARGRKKKKVRQRRKRIGKGQIKKKRRRRTPESPPPAIAIPRRRRTEPPPARFFGLQDITFGEGRRREGRRGEFEEEEPRRRRAPRAPPRRRRTDDFGLGNIFDVEF